VLNVYFNYPNSLVSIHSVASCGSIRPQRKAEQRLIQVTKDNLTRELQRLREREYKFASTAEKNDLWLKIDLGDIELETAVAKHFHRQLGKYYKPFAQASMELHC
jgi:hypothetical protein